MKALKARSGKCFRGFRPCQQSLMKLLIRRRHFIPLRTGNHTVQDFFGLWKAKPERLLGDDHGYDAVLLCSGNLKSRKAVWVV